MNVEIKVERIKESPKEKVELKNKEPVVEIKDEVTKESKIKQPVATKDEVIKESKIKQPVVIKVIKESKTKQPVAITPEEDLKIKKSDVEIEEVVQDEKVSVEETETEEVMEQLFESEDKSKESCLNLMGTLKSLTMYFWTASGMR